LAKFIANIFVTVDATLELAIGVKLFRFLLPPYSLICPATMSITAIFVTAQEYFVAYCRCREVAKLFMLLLSPYGLTRICSSVQHCIYEYIVNVQEYILLVGVRDY
jgi:hypothetical protein